MRPKVVIIGGGFGGLWCARALQGPGVDVTLIDRTNHHLFQPLLYQVATAGLSPGEIAQPIRGMLRNRHNLRVIMGDVARIEPGHVQLVQGPEIPYDYLVLATGARHSYFGHHDWEANATGLKSLKDATYLRSQILDAFERAERADDPAEQQRCLTFAVVGAGPTGVELSGAISELARRVLPRDFDRIRTESARILLIEAGPRVLPSFSESLSAKAMLDLERMGVQVLVDTRVEEVNDRGARTDKGWVESRTVIWAAGNEACVPASELIVKGRQGRVKVDEFCLAGPKIYAIGDCADHEGPDGKPLPGVSQVAMQAGVYVARHIRAAETGKKPLPPFRYWDKGSMATIGRRRAVAQIGKLEFTGTPAWLLWLGIHIFYLIGFRNKLIVLLQWGWAYAFWKPGVRLIIDAAPD